MITDTLVKACEREKRMNIEEQTTYLAHEKKCSKLLYKVRF